MNGSQELFQASGHGQFVYLRLPKCDKSCESCDSEPAKLQPILQAARGWRPWCGSLEPHECEKRFQEFNAACLGLHGLHKQEEEHAP